jgi:nicotinamide-nucleotide amidase
MVEIPEAVAVCATRVARLLDGRSVATAESCTAGLLAQAFAAVEGSGDWFRGGVVAYQRETKVALLGVEAHAPLVSIEVADQMARAVSQLLHADVTVATTGAAGPTPLDGARPGTVAIGWLVDRNSGSAMLHLHDTPEDVVERAAASALHALAAALTTGSRVR